MRYVQNWQIRCERALWALRPESADWLQRAVRAAAAIAAGGALAADAEVAQGEVEADRVGRVVCAERARHFLRGAPRQVLAPGQADEPADAVDMCVEIVGHIRRVLATGGSLPCRTMRSRPARGRARHRPRRVNSRRRERERTSVRSQRSDCCSTGTSSYQVSSTGPAMKRAGARGGPVDGSPRWSRMAFTGPGWVR